MFHLIFLMVIFYGCWRVSKFIVNFFITFVKELIKKLLEQRKGAN